MRYGYISLWKETMTASWLKVIFHTIGQKRAHTHTCTLLSNARRLYLKDKMNGILRSWRSRESNGNSISDSHLSFPTTVKMAPEMIRKLKCRCLQVTVANDSNDILDILDILLNVSLFSLTIHFYKSSSNPLWICFHFKS